MTVAWNDLLAALALVMVIEGIIPFVNPQSLRRLLAVLAQLDDRVLRMVGLSSMLLGIAILYVVR